MFNLNSGNQGFYTCTDGRFTDGWTCANQYAATRWPDKLVVFSRSPNEDYICDNVSNVSFLSHEFGHMCLSPYSPRGTFNGQPAETDNVMSYYQNVRTRISAMQAYLVRAAAYARGY